MFNIFILASVLGVSDFHGALGPLHVMTNERLERLMAGSNIINNQLSLIVISVIERL